MYKDSWINDNVFISPMNLKNGDNQKYLPKYEVKISKIIKEVWKEMHKLVLACVFIKIKIENHQISINSVENWQTFQRL